MIHVSFSGLSPKSTAALRMGAEDASMPSSGLNASTSSPYNLIHSEEIKRVLAEVQHVAYT